MIDLAIIDWSPGFTTGSGWMPVYGEVEAGNAAWITAQHPPPPQADPAYAIQWGALNGSVINDTGQLEGYAEHQAGFEILEHPAYVPQGAGGMAGIEAGVLGVPIPGVGGMGGVTSQDDLLQLLILILLLLLRRR